MQRIRATIVAACMMVGSSAFAASTNVNQTINPGQLTLAAPASASLSPVTVNISQPQTSSGSLGTVSVTDGRGTGAGWAVTATASSFARIGSAVRTSGSSGGGNFSSGGTYSGSTGGTYTVTITAGGPMGFAKFAVTGLESQTDTTATASASIGTRGVTGNFTSGMFSVGDQWTVTIDTLPVTGLTIAPSVVAIVAGAAAGVSSGQSRAFASDTDPMTLMSASSGSGMGQYSVTPTLSLTIPAGSKSGSYTATITQTLN